MGTQVGNIGQTIQKQLSSFVDLPKISLPTSGTVAGVTTVINRAMVTDFANDLMLRMGIDRMAIQAIVEAFGEYGPSNERVYKPANDTHDQVRFVGAWQSLSGNAGTYIQATTLADYTEVTFYGTGLNGLYYYDAGARTVGVSVDGGSVTNVAVTGNNTIIAGRNYAENAVVSLVQNLSLGLHTVKLTHTGANLHLTYGFEVITNSGTSPNVLQAAAGTSYNGGKKLSKAAATVESYNTGFDFGVLGSKGGRVLVYQKSDGTTGKGLTPTDTTQLTLATANHANEEIIRTHYWREFGAGRTDDFTQKFPNGVTTANLAFTLEDDTTTLIGTDVRSTVYGGAPLAAPIFVTTSGAVTITFVGTGIDILAQCDNNVRDWPSVTLDGVALGAYVIPAFLGTKRIPFASGLPYGTHVLKLVGDGGECGFDTALIYGPKKPTLPTGAVELGEYYIMATYVSGTTAGLETMATGVLRKIGTREAVYTGTWTNNVLQGDTNIGGFQTETAVTGSTAEYTFYGTGFELRGRTNTGSATLTLAQLQNLGTGGAMLDLQTGNYPGISGNNGTYGGYSFNQATGNLSSAASNNSGSGFWVKNLPLGLYKLKFINGAGNLTFRPEALDIITPIHCAKNNGPFVRQNALPCGSNAIKDNRTFSPVTAKTRRQLVRAASFATDTHSGAASTFQPLGQTSCSFYLDKDCDVEVIAEGQFGQTTATVQNLVLKTAVDGLELAAGNGRTHTYIGQISSQIVVVYREVVRLQAGHHHAIAYWHNNNTNAIQANNGERHSVTVNRLD